MVGRSFSSSALILLLLVSISSATKILSSYETAYLESTSRASNRRPKNKTTNPKPKPKPVLNSLKKGGPVIDFKPKKSASAVWRATTRLDTGWGADSKIKNLPGWDQIEKEIRAGGGIIPGPKGGASDRARCHMVGNALGGPGIRRNLFTCHKYFNAPAMSHLERLLKKEIKSLRGNEKCKMEVTLKYTTKEYPTSVNMNARCKGRQFFNVNIANEFLRRDVKIDHLCMPSIALGPNNFTGTAIFAPNADPC